MSTTGMSQEFGTASRALRLKRRAFSNEITAFLQSAKSDTPPAITEFRERQVYFAKLWDNVVTSTEDCIKLIHEDEDLDGEEARALTDTLEDLRYKIS